MEILEEVLTSAKKALVKCTNGWTGGVCAGMTMKADTGDCVYNGHGACHVWVTDTFRRVCKVGGTFDYSYEEYPKDAKNFLTLTSHHHRMSKASPEATDAIIHWLAKDSPFSKFILNRDDDESLKYGAIILCGPDGASLAQAMWICKLLRYSTEGSKALDTWKALYDGGINPFLAALVATSVSSVVGSTYRFSPVCSHVTTFGRQGNEPDMAKLLKGDSDPRAKNTSDLFGCMGKAGDVQGKIRSFCEPKKVSDGWGDTASVKSVTAAQLVEKITKWQNEIEKTINPLPTSTSEYLDIDL